MPASALTEASNYVNARLRGRTLESARGEMLAELDGDAIGDLGYNSEIVRDEKHRELQFAAQFFVDSFAHRFALTP